MNSAARFFFCLSSSKLLEQGLNTFLREPKFTLVHSAREKADLLCTPFASNYTQFLTQIDDAGKAPPIIPWFGHTMREVCFEQKTDRRAFLHGILGGKPDGIPTIMRLD
ncbi:unnamed protein product [Euphydryas editha]|uniref:Uncharacterized protein n=1 Tax=Euphydryas editha TaxID=104508 RepID=A0AAU9U870_EUPED|nr:unnamed protein product [Euphydryas editha]